MCILTDLQNKYLSLVLVGLCVMHEYAISWTLLSIEVQISLSWLTNPVFFFNSLWRWDVFCTVAELKVSIWKSTKDALFTFVLITHQFEMYVSWWKAEKKVKPEFTTRSSVVHRAESCSWLNVTKLWGSVSDSISQWVTADTEVRVDSPAPFNVLCKGNAPYRHTLYFTPLHWLSFIFQIASLGLLVGALRARPSYHNEGMIVWWCIS